MSALPAPSGRNEATSVHTNGLAPRKATAQRSAVATAGHRRFSSLAMAARSAFHDPEGTEGDGEQDRHADQRRRSGLAVVEILVRRLEDVIEQQVGGI